MKKINDFSRAKLLCFDLDGTLADTLDGICEGVRMALEKLGYPPRDEAHVRRSIGNGPMMLCRRVLPDEKYNDLEAAAQLLEVYRGTYAETYRMTQVPYDGMYEAVAELKARGYTLAVLSNKQDELVGDMVERIFPNGEFSLAWGTTAARKGKPDPAGLLDVCRTLGFGPEETVMIGDGETDYAEAVNAGLCGSIIVTWGFRSKEDLAAAGATVFADSPADIVRLLTE